MNYCSPLIEDLISVLKTDIQLAQMNYIVEYAGEGVKTLSVPERATITNMGAELGATTSVFPSDDVTKAFLKAQGREEDWVELKADDDAVYDEVIDINLSELAPMAACPHMPDRVKSVTEIGKIKVDQVCIGSCTNSSLLDMLKVAALLKGRTIKLLVNSSDSLRVRVAYEISRMLNASGVVVEVVEKPSNAYEVALVERNYDMYLGQTKLSANMDLTPFFTTYGNLSYGGIDDVGVYTLCLQALENQGNYYTLHQRVMEDAYLCPILFRSYAVYASRGMLTELKPARDNLFCYSIGRTLTEAYVLDDE